MIVDQDRTVLGKDYAESEYSMVGELFDTHAVDGRVDDPIDQLLAQLVADGDRADGTHATGGDALLVLGLGVIAGEGKQQISLVVHQCGDGKGKAAKVLLYQDVASLEQFFAEGDQLLGVSRIDHHPARSRPLALDDQAFSLVAQQEGFHRLGVAEQLVARCGDVVAVGESSGKVPVSLQLQRFARATEAFDALLRELVHHRAEQWLFGADEDKVDVVVKAGLIDLPKVLRIDVKIDGERFGAIVARCDIQILNEMTAGKPPCQSMVFGSRS